MKLLWTAVIAGLALGMQAAETPMLKEVQRIPLDGVKGRFDHFAIDAKGQRLFVAALGNNTLEVIDLAAGKRVRSVAGMAKPTGVLYLAQANQVLVGNGDDGTLKVLGGSEFETVQNLSGLDDADNLRLDAKRKLAWLGYGDGALAIVDPGSAKVIGRVKMQAHPESFQLEPEGTRVFVNLPDAKRIAVVDRELGAVVASWPMEKYQANFPMALDAANGRLFVGCRHPARLVVFDTGSGTVVSDLAISGDTDDLFYDGKRKRLYVSCGEGFVDVIEQAGPNTYKPGARVPTATGARTSFFSAALDRLYLAVPDRGSQRAEIRVYQPQ